MIRIGVIGCGYWGPNLIRNFTKVRDCEIVAVADNRPERLEAVRFLNPGMKLTTMAEELIESSSIDAVVIATPVSTHFELARTCIQNYKHVWIEKPMTVTASEARELVRLAEENACVLMVDHTFIYSGAVRKLREIIDSGELGDIYYFDSVRLNFGLFRQDVNVLWDLGPHDFSLLTYLLGRKPIHVSALGSRPVRWTGWNQESIAYVTVELEGNILAHFHLNWLSPIKLRRTLIGGSRKMVMYDHLDCENQIKVFDKGVDVIENEDRRKLLMKYRTGDLWIPKVDQTEALETASKHFIECIQKLLRPITDGYAGLRVVELLESAERSMKQAREDSEVWEVQTVAA